MEDRLPNTTNDSNNSNISDTSDANNGAVLEQAEQQAQPKRKGFRPINLAIMPVLVLSFVVLAAGGVLFYLRKSAVPQDIYTLQTENSGAGWAGICGVSGSSSEFTPPSSNYPNTGNGSKTACYKAPDRSGYPWDDYNCDLDSKSCTGYVWKYVCDAPGDIDWSSLIASPGNQPRACVKGSDGSNQGIKFEKLYKPDGQNTTYGVGDVGCGKIVQLDITPGNCEPGTTGNELSPDNCGKEYDTLLWYTGACEEEVSCLSYDYEGETTSGWDECNYCFDENNDGKLDNPKPGEVADCNERERICREKSVARFNSIAPNYQDLFGDIKVPLDNGYAYNDSSTEGRTAWFNFGYEVVEPAPNSGDRGHILSRGTACGMGDVCCTAPNTPATHMECSANYQCVEVSGGGEDTCEKDSDCFHFECTDSNECAKVGGDGTNECSVANQAVDCATPSHLVCEGLSCVNKDGEGSDECSVDSDCYYMACDDGTDACKKYSGDNSDSCSSDNDCITPTPTPTPNPTPTPTPVPDPTIACSSLTGIAFDNLGQEVDLNTIPNDFIGTLQVTCLSNTTRKEVTKVEFSLDKLVLDTVDVQTAVVIGDNIVKTDEVDGVMHFKASTTFEITGAGTYTARSKVCNEDNVCSP